MSDCSELPLHRVVPPDLLLLLLDVVLLSLGELRVLTLFLRPTKRAGEVVPAEEPASRIACVFSYDYRREPRRPAFVLVSVYLSKHPDHRPAGIPSGKAEARHQLAVGDRFAF